jgi:Domain of unknown function (DUF4338)
MESDELRQRIIESLTQQGFQLLGGRLLPPPLEEKSGVRALHRMAVEHRRNQARPGLQRHEARLLSYFACGKALDPERIDPDLVEVSPDSEEELLFRYACLHWSIPVSSGYGRRLRFLVMDRQNGKLIGLFGLGDPVFALGARDAWIGWTAEDRKERLHHVLDAFVLGAVVPYSRLLCGKLVAMLAASNEVRSAFERKYQARSSFIRGRELDGRLLLVTTSSALGRSSIYRRLRFDGRLLFESVGFTKGSGEFQFLNGVYEMMVDHASNFCTPTAKQELWGAGFRNRREVVRKCLASIGLSLNWNYHGVRREVFVVPLASNTPAFLSGQESLPTHYDQPSAALSEHFRTRWLRPRAERDLSFREVCPSSLRLWES